MTSYLYIDDQMSSWFWDKNGHFWSLLVKPTNLKLFIIYKENRNYSFPTIENKWFSRISRSQMFLKIGVLKNVANFTGKDLRWSLFLIKLQAYNFIKETPTQMFFVKFTNFLRTPFFTEHARWLLLVLISPSCTILYTIKFFRYIINKITDFRKLNILRFLAPPLKFPQPFLRLPPSSEIAFLPRIIVSITS